MAGKEKAEAPAKAAKKAVKKEDDGKSKATLKAEARRPKGDPSEVFKIEVFSRGDDRAVYIAHARDEKLMTSKLREALAFFENLV